MEVASGQTELLAICGGTPANPPCDDQRELFHWPIVTDEDKLAVWDVMQKGIMSETGVTKTFEQEYAAYTGVRHALAHCNGTMAILTAMWAVGLRRGDEVICPSITYWASALPAFALGATVRFADIDPTTLCLDPGEIDRLVTPRTRAVLVVHYCGHPADMDAIMAAARRHKLKVIEDVSHAQGSMHKGRMCGSIGDVGAASLMGAKSLVAGEGGMITTDDPAVYEAAVAFAHYERHKQIIQSPHFIDLVGLPLGGVKGRINQMASAFGRVQLKHYPARIAQIDRAMRRFWDLLADVPGLAPLRPTAPDLTMGGWYNPIAHYQPRELGGLSVDRFTQAVNAEGGRTGRGVNFPLHLHPVFRTADVYGDGGPTRNAFSDHDMCEANGTLPASERLAQLAFGVPWFKHDRPDLIERYAAAYRKVVQLAHTLVTD